MYTHTHKITVYITITRVCVYIYIHCYSEGQIFKVHLCIVHIMVLLGWLVTVDTFSFQSSNFFQEKWLHCKGEVSELKIVSFTVWYEDNLDCKKCRFLTPLWESANQNHMCVCIYIYLYTHISPTDLCKVLGSKESSEDFIKNADSDPGGLEWAMRWCLSQSSHVIVRLVVHRPHLE